MILPFFEILISSRRGRARPDRRTVAYVLICGHTRQEHPNSETLTVTNTRINATGSDPLMHLLTYAFALTLNHHSRLATFQGEMRVSVLGHGVGSRVLDHLIAWGIERGASYPTGKLHLSGVDAKVGTEEDEENMPRRNQLYRGHGFNVEFPPEKNPDGAEREGYAWAERLDQLEVVGMKNTDNEHTEARNVVGFLKDMLAKQNMLEDRLTGCLRNAADDTQRLQKCILQLQRYRWAIVVLAIMLAGVLALR